MAEYFIPTNNYQAFLKELKSFNRKAERNNITINFKEVGKTIVVLSHSNTALTCVKVEIDGYISKDDWTVIGHIDHDSDLGSNLLFSYGDELIPIKYANADTARCDHCKSHRKRNRCFIVKKDNDYKIIGSSCIKEYTGIEPGVILAYNAIKCYLQTEESLQSDEYYGKCDKHSLMINIHDYLMFVLAEINTTGYISNSKAKDMNVESTAYTAADLYRKYGDIKGCYNFDEETFAVYDNKVVEVIEWIRSYNSKEYNEYIFNLKTMTKSDYCDPKFCGYLASLFSVYDKCVIAKNKTIPQGNEFVGEVKSKVTFQIKSAQLIATSSMPVAYGTYAHSYGYKFTDEDNHIFVWWASKEINITDIENKMLTGTVKDHNEYRGIKQTIITRCKIV